MQTIMGCLDHADPKRDVHGALGRKDASLLFCMSEHWPGKHEVKFPVNSILKPTPSPIPVTYLWGHFKVPGPDPVEKLGGHCRWAQLYASTFPLEVVIRTFLSGLQRLEGGQVMTEDPDVGADLQSCRGAWVTSWLAPGSSHNTVPRPCATSDKDWMGKATAPWGFLTGRGLLCTKAAHVEALEGQTSHGHVSWRTASWVVRGCPSAAPSVPPGWGWGCVLGTWGDPRRARQGWSRNAPVFLGGHLLRTDVPKAESQGSAGEWQNHGAGQGYN